MTNGYLTFLDYLALRRRVEKRLESGKLFLLHIIIFAVGTGMIGSAAWSPYWYSGRDYFINPTVGHWISLWSGLLLGHGLFSYWRSGAWAGRRDDVIESEMRERLQADDLYLSEHPKALFRLHGLLSDDVGKRARLIPTLLVFVVVNALIWIPWTLVGEAFTSFAWQTSFLLVVPFILALLWSVWRRARHEKRMREQMETLFGQEVEDDEDIEREVRLGDDGELVTMDEYVLKQKRKRA